MDLKEAGDKNINKVCTEIELENVDELQVLVAQLKATVDKISNLKITMKTTSSYKQKA